MTNHSHAEASLDAVSTEVGAQISPEHQRELDCAAKERQRLLSLSPEELVAIRRAEHRDDVDTASGGHATKRESNAILPESAAVGGVALGATTEFSAATTSEDSQIPNLPPRTNTIRAAWRIALETDSPDDWAAVDKLIDMRNKSHPDHPPLSRVELMRETEEPPPVTYRAHDLTGATVAVEEGGEVVPPESPWPDDDLETLPAEEYKQAS